jgi:hypothetical protein
MLEMEEGKGLPQTAFYFHKIEGTGEWKGLPRITFCYNQHS